MTPTRRGFSQSEVSFFFFSTYFPPSYDPPARLHPGAHRSAFTPTHTLPLCCVGPPQNIHFHLYLRHLIHLLYPFFLFCFFINTTNTDRRANSANLEILWNCYVMRYVSVVLILRWFIAILWLSSTSFLSSVCSPPLIRDLDVEFCCSRTKTRPKRGKSDSADVFMAVCGDTRDLCKLSSLTSCCPSTIKFVCLFTINQSG